MHIAYQMMFAIITPALITGAFANRVTFKAYFLFLTGWLVFVYFPFVHMLWSPDGILAKWGVEDFAGGIVVHATAGFAALASMLYVGRRYVVENKPHNVPLIALGTGLLWFGWYGFNAGSELRVDAVTASAFLNTDIAASFAAIVWLLIEWGYGRQPKFIGLLTGAVAGLATITPAAGYVSPTRQSSSAARRVSSATLRSRSRTGCGWDDALDVWGVHGVGGFLGIVLLGVFGSTLWNPNGSNGLIYGGGSLLPQAAYRRHHRQRRGLLLHLRVPMADQPGHADQGRAGGRRARSGHRTSRRGSIPLRNLTSPPDRNGALKRGRRFRFRVRENPCRDNFLKTTISPTQA